MSDFPGSIADQVRFRISNLAGRFRGNRQGAAAIEFALVAPLLVFSFLLMGDFATALSTQDATARKARRAVEGVLRYGDDKDKVAAFANANGAAAFAQSSNPAINDVALQIDRFYVCPDSVLPTAISLLKNATCDKPEIWYKVTASASSVGMFGKNYEVDTKVDILVDKK